MRLFISTTLFDLAGDLMLQSADFLDDRSTSRRVTRTATLDGLAALVDQGATDADLTFDISAQATEAEASQLRLIVANHSAVSIATASGFFSGVLASVNPAADGSIRAQFLPVAGVR